MSDTPLADYIAAHYRQPRPKIIACRRHDTPVEVVNGRKIGPKSPHPKLAPSGVYSATDNYEALQAHTDYDPACNVACCPGEYGLVVLDFDPKNGGYASKEALETRLGPLPDTHTTSTPSGGLHLRYKGAMPSRNNVGGNEFPGVDVKSTAGYVLLPPSQTADGMYRVVVDRPPAELPAAWRAFLTSANPQRREPAKAAPDVELGTPEQENEFIAELKRRRPAVEGQGGDTRTFAVAARAKELGVLEDRCVALMLEHYNPRCEPPWDPDELEVKVANAYRYAENEAGSRAQDADPASVWAQSLSVGIEDVPAAAEPAMAPARDERLDRFRGREPDEYLPRLGRRERARQLGEYTGDCTT